MDQVSETSWYKQT